MGYKAAIAKFAAKVIVPSIYKEHSAQNAATIQHRMLRQFVELNRDTVFGKEHHFDSIQNYEDFKKAVPVRDYEDLKGYIEQIAAGTKDVLWQGQPLYFCKSSGTTSGTKYIPLTKESVSEQIRAARNSLLMYIHQTGKANCFDQKMIFLQGSPVLDTHGVIPSGRLSGIVYHHVPAYLTKNRMPSYDTNCIEDWEQKVEQIAKETLQERMSLISGIPPWVVMYFEKLQELSGKEFIKDIFPDFKLFAYGGVNYEPYRSKIEKLIGAKIDSVETYPASEGFIAFQDSQTNEGLLLNINSGIFYEFIKMEDAFKPNAERISLPDVELNVNYVLILTTNAGLWAYNLGDTIRFVSKAPYRIVVTGRVKHFISAFGEHVIGEEVEYCMQQVSAQMGVEITEFTVAPQVSPSEGLPYHEWFVEFSKAPKDIAVFAKKIDEALQQKNSYYFDLREGNILQQLKIVSLKKNAFVDYMKSIGKLGGQNKVPRLANDRKIAEVLSQYSV